MGLVWGLLAAAGYAALNLCLRAVAEVDPFVSTLVRVFPTVLFAWAVLGLEWQRDRQQAGRHRAERGWAGRGWAGRRSGRTAADRASPGLPAGLPLWPGWRVLWPLVAAGALQMVVGNGSFQVGLALSGLTVTVPATSGASIWGTALGAWWLLREGLTVRAVLGLMLLVVSLPLLTSSGGGGAGPAWLGALAGALAGLSYGTGNIVMRRATLAHRLSHGMTLASIQTTGLLGLLLVVLPSERLGALLRLDGATTGWLLFAGLFGTLAFVSLAKALTLLPASRAGALSALQTALSAVGGVLFFLEPWTATVALGLVLSLIGAFLAQQRKPPASSRASMA